MGFGVGESGGPPGREEFRGGIRWRRGACHRLNSVVPPGPEVWHRTFFVIRESAGEKRQGAGASPGRAQRQSQKIATAFWGAADLRCFARVNRRRRIDWFIRKVLHGRIIDRKRLLIESRPAKAPEGWRTPGRSARSGSRKESRQRPGVRRPSAAFAWKLCVEWRVSGAKYGARESWL